MLKTSLSRLLGGNVKRFVATAFFLVVPRFRPRLKDQLIGINLIGYHRGDLGLGQSLRYVAQVLQKIDFPFLVRSFQVTLKTSQNDHSLDAHEANYCQYPINLIAINPDMIYRIPLQLGYREWGQRYNIAHWFWELETFPSAWRYCLPLIDEIWVHTEFNALTMRQEHRSVVKIPFAVEFPTPAAHFNRQFFQLPENTCLFLCTFDFNSSLSRKNPKATIEAFLRAFPDPDAPVGLIVKSGNGHQHPQALQALRERANNDPRILFLDNHLPTESMRGLLNCADCYVSLHRSEGLGLGMAESMYLSKPVIATAYSGNLEFMNADNACLIPYQLIPVQENDYPHHVDQFWADADIPAAAQAMAKIFAEPAFRLQLGEQAHQYMRAHHSFSIMGEAIQRRLKEVIQILK